MCTFKRHVEVLALVGILVASALWAVTVPATAATTAQNSVTVTPAVVGRGGTVIISGSVATASTCPTGAVVETSSAALFPNGGFGPGIPLNTDGGFSTPYTLPTTANPGTYAIELDCDFPYTSGHGPVPLGVFASLQVTSQQASAPTALANSPSLMNVFFTTSSGHIGNDYWTPARGWVSQTLPGPADALSAPTALANSPSLMNVFFTTSSGQIGNDYWTPARGWVSQTLPGPADALGAPIALANSPSLMNVFFSTSPGNGLPGNDYWTPSGGWVSQTLPGPVNTVSAPSALANSPSPMNVFYTDLSYGIDNDSWTPSAGWVNQALFGLAGAASAPSALANSSSLMNVFFSTPSEQIGNDYWTLSGGWVNQTLPGPADALSAPSVLANSPSLMNVFFTTPSGQNGGQIGNDYWTPSRGWISQTLPGPADALSAPSALANSSSLMNVFFTTPSGRIRNDYWTPSAGWITQTLPGPGAGT